jgi:hypothetical protein
MRVSPFPLFFCWTRNKKNLKKKKWRSFIDVIGPGFSFIQFLFDYSRELGVEKDLGYVKDVVNQEYTVVGTLEKMGETLDLLETTVPQFFKGIKNIYYQKRIYSHSFPSFSRDF